MTSNGLFIDSRAVPRRVFIIVSFDVWASSNGVRRRGGVGCG